MNAAVQAYETLIRQGFERPEIFHRLTVSYDQTDRSNLSLPLYERALNVDPDNPEILCDLGYRMQLMGNSQAAERFFNVALQYAPKNASANNNLGILLAQQHRETEALSHFRTGGLNIWRAKTNPCSFNSQS